MEWPGLIINNMLALCELKINHENILKVLEMMDHGSIRSTCILLAQKVLLLINNTYVRSILIIAFKYIHT